MGLQTYIEQRKQDKDIISHGTCCLWLSEF